MHEAFLLLHYITLNYTTLFKLAVFRDTWQSLDIGPTTAKKCGLRAAKEDANSTYQNKNFKPPPQSQRLSGLWVQLH